MSRDCDLTDLHDAMIRLGVRLNPEMQEGLPYRYWVYDSELWCRVLLKSRFGEVESDLEMCKVTRLMRIWINGGEIGRPEWN